MKKKKESIQKRIKKKMDEIEKLKENPEGKFTQARISIMNNETLKQIKDEMEIEYEEEMLVLEIKKLTMDDAVCMLIDQYAMEIGLDNYVQDDSSNYRKLEDYRRLV